MNEMVKKRWSAVDGRIVFELTINRQAHLDNIPSVAIISGGDATSAVTVPIALTKPSLFDVKFRSGLYVQGYFHQTPPARKDGVLESLIIGDFHYGTKDARDDHHFEGVMASVPVRGA